MMDFRQIGKTPKQYRAAVRDGALAHDSFGHGAAKTRTYNDYRHGNYCRGLISTIYITLITAFGEVSS